MPTYKRLTGGDVAIIRQILGRVHVSCSNLAAVRAVRRAIRKPWTSIDREVRREIVRAAIEEHQDNRGLYLLVVSARL